MQLQCASGTRKRLNCEARCLTQCRLEASELCTSTHVTRSMIADVRRKSPDDMLTALQLTRRTVAGHMRLRSRSRSSASDRWGTKSPCNTSTVTRRRSGSGGDQSAGLYRKEDACLISRRALPRHPR
jgi:hypothetical protein